MKYVIVLLMFFTLAGTGCTSVDYGSLSPSKANLTNIVVVNDTGKKDTIAFSLDYSIENYHSSDPSPYHCSVQFILEDNSSYGSALDASGSACEIKDQQGTLVMAWPTPLNTTQVQRSRLAKDLELPLRYFIAIHQLTGPRSSTIIGKSDVVTRSISNEE